MSANNPLLNVERLSVCYGKVEAVRQVSLAIGEGQIVSVIGPNGAGKTTLLGALMGLLPAEGEVAYLGKTLQRHHGVAQRVGQGLNLVPESRELFSPMSVEDNLLLGAFSRHRQGHRDHGLTLAEVFDLFPRLKERRRQAAGTMSGGERQMLAMGRALMAKPKLLMLDEPSLGLAPRVIGEIFRIITELRATGVSILLVEQNARAALKCSDYGYVLENGEVALQGPAAELADDPKVIETYLGRKSAAPAPAAAALAG
ncbi:branched-chain amino acid transport system ATP-binding protein [Pseudomonas linyingensis]|jgi:branched-chain amino acid transport system ATP-binding protein|uniref:Branched-chain amino acid transport system ATP-binding protein n=1 Tax=Pseudomonas linyingensis TaxID=915471 RepID=A0A1H6YLA7_9PSED|nr:ABC transporter ATP-binding protein [Pseudomonas linyingensis]SEJ42059.1 branched-chain amino acid transport system ATP-binding protein [Pseudomonas linyingensis]